MDSPEIFTFNIIYISKILEKYNQSNNIDNYYDPNVKLRRSKFKIMKKGDVKSRDEK